MNKAIELASGDVVGILNSDDLYIDELVIQKIVIKPDGVTQFNYVLGDEEENSSD